MRARSGFAPTARQASSVNCPTACECWFVPGAREHQPGEDAEADEREGAAAVERHRRGRRAVLGETPRGPVERAGEEEEADEELRAALVVAVLAQGRELSEHLRGDGVALAREHLVALERDDDRGD